MILSDMKNIIILVLVAVIISLFVLLYLKSKKQPRPDKKSRLNRRNYQSWMPSICSEFYKDHHEVWGKLNVIERDLCDFTREKYCLKIVDMWNNELVKHFKEEEVNFFPNIINEDNKDFINDLLLEHKNILLLVNKINLERKKLDILYFCSLLKYHIMKEEILMTEITPDTYRTKTPINI